MYKNKNYSYDRFNQETHIEFILLDICTYIIHINVIRTTCFPIINKNISTLRMYTIRQVSRIIAAPFFFPCCFTEHTHTTHYIILSF